VRQITDLAEQKIITPVRETPGQGIPRFYDQRGVLEIAIASTLRALVSPRHAKLIMDFVHRTLESSGDSPFDVLVIRPQETGRTLEMTPPPMLYALSFGEISEETIRSPENPSESPLVREARKRSANAGKPVAVPADPGNWRAIILNITDMQRAIKQAIEAVEEIEAA
jgi:hypothetical protein